MNNVTYPAQLSILEDWYEVKRNCFGGRKILLDGNATDIWSLETTWGIREGYVKNEGLKSFVYSCAFDTDAAVVLPSQGIAYAKGMINSFKRKKIGMILDVNPIPLSTAIKAFRLQHKYGLEFDESVVNFIKRARENYQPSHTKLSFE